MTAGIQTAVLDAGGRYGLHPTWKPFTGELDYYLFEPDPIESARLAKKYAHRAAEIKVCSSALAQQDGYLTINYFRNRAMSSSAVRNPVSSLFKGEQREAEVEVVERIEAKAESIDSFCTRQHLSLDFLKLDTEGNEYQILLGAIEQLKTSILGVRCEVSFDYIFDGMPLFSTLHDFMLSKGFFLLNIDYDGKGDYQNNFVKTNERYGILTASDAVWMRRPHLVFESQRASTRSVEIQVMKYAAFCLMNHAPDVAVNMLLEARQKHGIDFSGLSETRLYKYLDISIHKLFYSLKWQPGQLLSVHQDTFYAIFGKKMRVMNEYMESTELNPD
jgi:FkbM family methyltransferase